MDSDGEDLLQDGRVRIVSDEQAANLRERQHFHDDFERFWAKYDCGYEGPRRMDAKDAEADQLGEESQDLDDQGWGA